MIEIIVRDYLEAALSIPVFLEYPSDAPGRFVVLRTGDTTRDNRIETTTFVAESYDVSMYEAAKLNRLVMDAMDDLDDLPEISASHHAVDYPVFDERHKRYRYQAVYNVTHY